MSAHTDCLHPRTGAARAACRRSKTRRQALLPMIREALDVTYIEAVREASSYDHAEYERAWRVASGLIMAFVDGDVAYARAIEAVWVDCQELHYEDRDRLVYDMGTYEKDDEEDLEKRLGIHWSQLEEYQDVDPDAEHDRLVDVQLSVD